MKKDSGERRFYSGKGKSFSDKMTPIMYLVIGLFLVWVIVLPAIKLATGQPEEQRITFNVVGVTDSMNASTLVQVHFECIKWCGRETYRENCWGQCEKLGREGCP